jgi:hypothetical protein
MSDGGQLEARAVLDRPLDQQEDADRDFATGLDVPVGSLAICRLIEEVRSEEDDVPRSYNRTFNRHNR